MDPRTCGAYCRVRTYPLADAGLSPRARGSPLRACVATPRTRYIPAGAGQFCRWSAAGRLIAVHPRTCGVLASGWLSHQRGNGWPPRVGALLHGSFKLRAARVHPAACGAPMCLNSIPCSSTGSPPLVWGQTGRSASHVPSFRVYPRARGVQSVLTAFLTRTSVWSTPARAADRCRLVRPVEFTAPSELVGTQARSRRRCGLKA